MNIIHETHTKLMFLLNKSDNNQEVARMTGINARNIQQYRTGNYQVKNMSLRLADQIDQAYQSFFKSPNNKVSSIQGIRLVKGFDQFMKDTYIFEDELYISKEKLPFWLEVIEAIDWLVHHFIDLGACFEPKDYISLYKREQQKKPP